MKQINLTNESLGHNIAVEEENVADRLRSQSRASLFQNAPTDTKGPLWRRTGCGDTEDETRQLWECWEALFVEFSPLKHIVWVWVIRDREPGAEIFSHFIINRLWRWSAGRIILPVCESVCECALLFGWWLILCCVRDQVKLHLLDNFLCAFG